MTGSATLALGCTRPAARVATRQTLMYVQY
jgi:hypothetical protein